MMDKNKTKAELLSELEELRHRGGELEESETEIKRAEKTLRQSEEGFRSLVETTTDWFWEVDENAVYTYSSPKIHDILGYEPEEVLGNTPFSLMPPEEADRIANIFAPYAKSRKPFKLLENTNVHKDGHLVVLETSGIPIFDFNGVFRGYRGIDRDITERKRAEEELRKAHDDMGQKVEERTSELLQANEHLKREIENRKGVEERLRESEEKYRRLVETSIDGIAIVQGTEMKFANKALLDMYGATGAEEIIGHNFTEFIAHEHRDLLMRRGQDRERGKNVPVRYEFKALKLDESEFDVEISVNPIFYQGKPARQAFLRDISERKRAEDALRESEEKYRLLVDSLPSIVYKGYKDWSVEFFDEKIEVLTGHSMKEFNSGRMKWSDLVVAEDIGGARETFIKALKTDKSYVREYRIKVTSGDIQWIQERANIICDDKGEIEHVSGVFFDITERKEAEAALKESEAYIKGILNAAPAGIGLVRARELNWVSDRMCEMLGYSADELVGQSARIAYESNEEFERVGRVKYSEIQERGAGSVETRFKRKDGSVLDVLLCSSAVDPGDLSKGAIFTVLDITERKQAENVLQESEQRFRAVLEAVPDLMLILDPEGVYREVFTANSDLLYAPVDQ
ncbi:MAG: PAS domain S-box protein, partial [Deltaproteobacteria bacterium]|nr:PAS domain S-box protein [Deltaproteobacteria bacterium]